MINLQSNIIKEIEKDRNGEIVKESSIKTAIQQFIYMGYNLQTNIYILKNAMNDFEWRGEKNLKVYEEHFETKLCEHTRKYYAEKAKYWLLNMGCF